jgi:cyclic pyranopterin monophosphate synthase
MSDDSRLTHVDDRGRAVMVDVTAKDLTHRRAATTARVTGVVDAVRRFGPGGPDADALSSARVAGLRAGKATSELVPLCHPLPLTDLSVEFDLGGEEIEVLASAETVGQTGVEMEALTACALAALSLVSYLGATDSGVAVEDLTLLEKRGGRSGTWSRPTASRPNSRAGSLGAAPHDDAGTAGAPNGSVGP